MARAKPGMGAGKVQGHQGEARTERAITDEANSAAICRATTNCEVMTKGISRTSARRCRKRSRAKVPRSGALHQENVMPENRARNKGQSANPHTKGCRSKRPSPIRSGPIVWCSADV